MSETERVRIRMLRNQANKLRREEFAKAALTGLCSTIDPDGIYSLATGATSGTLAATAAWKIADKMIELGDK